MRGVVMYEPPGDVPVVEREDPKIIVPTDAVIRITATCICGSDLWPYRGVEPVDHTLMGHEYVGDIFDACSQSGGNRAYDQSQRTDDRSPETRGVQPRRTGIDDRLQDIASQSRRGGGQLR